MAKRKPMAKWTLLEGNLSSEPPAYDRSYAVHHSFGRGSFRSVAENVIVPKLVLDQIIGSQCWTEKPRGPTRNRKELESDRSWTEIVGGAASGRMGGVKEGLRPKSSGRARALHMRVQKASNIQQRRPGSKAIQQPQATPIQLPKATPNKGTSSRSSGSPFSSLVFSTPPEEGITDSLPSFSPSHPHSSNSTPNFNSSPTTSRRILKFETSPENTADFSADSVLSSGSTPNSTFRSNLTSDSVLKFESNGHGEDRNGDLPLLMEPEEGVLPYGTPASGREGGYPGSTLASSRGGELEMDWILDFNTLYFENIPASVTAKELEQCIDTFGKVTNVKILKAEQQGVGETKDSCVAYVRMKDGSSCPWVISCFHGNSYENSSGPVMCRHALDLES